MRTAEASDAAHPGSAPACRVLARFPHPEPPRGPRRRVLPVFLPFAGCPGRCVFCNQPAQTGQAPEPLNVVYERLARRLAELPSPGPDARPPGSASPESATPESAAPELAFYGGTFTALPAPWPRRFLELSRQHLMAGRLSRVRCSTRPDAVDALMLAELKTLGLSLVELGVQSFDDGALAASRRGYDGEAALRGCRAVREAGLSLGVQLMPGMPGQTPAAFRTDIAQTSALAPELARLYPCLVLEGTALADSWRGGMYCPWPLPATVDELARALLVLWEAGVPAARIGLAEQEGLTVLAGPRHPALGQMVRARALFSRVRRAVAELAHVVDLTGDDRAADAQPTNVEPVNAGTTNVGGANLLLLPRRLRGEALGQLGALAADYAGIGLTVRFWDEPDLALGAQR